MYITKTNKIRKYINREEHLNVEDKWSETNNILDTN